MSTPITPASRPPATIEPPVSLLAMDPPEPGRRLAVDRSFFVIGRSPHSHLQLSDPAVSAQHAALVRRGASVRIRDLGSTNGTSLNGRLLRLEEAVVEPGDLLEITPFRFTIEFGQQASLATVRRRDGAPDQPVRFRLIALDDEELGRTIEVRNPRLVIGREIGCDLLLPDAAVSSRHAVLLVRGQQVFLQDLGSTNGTLVNGVVVSDEEVELADSDEIEITPFHFSVALGEPEVILPAAPAESGDPGASGVAARGGTPPLPARAIRPSRSPGHSDWSLPPDTSQPATAPPATSPPAPAEPDSTPSRAPTWSASPSPSIRETLGEVVFACPSCGSPGRASVLLLDRPLQCRDCSARFRVDSGGRPTLEDSAAPSLSERVSWTAEAGSSIGGAVSRLARRALPVLAVIAALGLLGYGISLLGGLRRGAPADLPGRARFVARAFLDEDPAAITPLAVPGTEEDLASWVRLARQPGWRNRVNPRIEPAATIRNDLPESADAVRVMLRFDLRFVAKDDVSGFIPTIWKQHADGTWRIDGTATRKATPAALREPAKKLNSL